MIDLKEALDTALRAARAGARVHQQHLGQVNSEDWSEKGVADFVTHVDREAEAHIVETINARYPDHYILAEEAASEAAPNAGNAEFVWIVDPLDGTTNFLHQYPMYCASVGLLQNGSPVAAAIVSAPTNEAWTATHGGGAFRNGQRISVSQNDVLPRALIGTGFPFKKPHVFEQYLKQFHAVATRVSDIRRAGSAALDLCHVATGYFDGFWELDLRPWDYAAGVLLVREAGGIATGLEGGEPNWVEGGGIIAGNHHVYNALTEIL